MITLGSATRIFLATGATDLRKSFEGLSDLVRGRLKEEPLSGHIFVFVNRRKDRLKLLYWDGSGLWVATKRLERGRFHWPEDQAGASAGSLRIVAEELALLIGGIDLRTTRLRPWWRKVS